MATELTPAVGYIRMSTDKQADSPERQRAEIERYAEQNNYGIIRWYEDHGLTGTESSNRPEYQRIFTDTASGDFSALIVYELSRASREKVLEALMSFKRFADAGVCVGTVLDGPINFDDLAGLLTFVVKQHESHNESLKIAARTTSGERLKRANVWGAQCMGSTAS